MTAAGTLRRCPRCRHRLPVSAFGRNRRNPDGISTWCRACSVKDARYRTTSCPERHARAKRRVMEKTLEGRAAVREYLRAHGCIDCGESDPDVLEFDHRVRRNGDRGLTIGRFILNPRRLAEEMAACDVRCANCHRRRHAWERRAMTYEPPPRWGGIDLTTEPVI